VEATGVVARVGGRAVRRVGAAGSRCAWSGAKRDAGPAPEPWQVIAARLAANDPVEWGPLADLVDVDDEDWFS
jgi:hypothetical protein